MAARAWDCRYKRNERLDRSGGVALPASKREPSMASRDKAPVAEILSGRDELRVELFRAGFFGEGYAR